MTPTAGASGASLANSVDGSSARFVREAHHLVRDLARERPARYFVDFSVTMLLAYAALAVYLMAPTFSPLQGAALIVCGLALYRAVVFTHELAHRRHGSFVAFTWLWNALCGVPSFVPSFLYGDHKSHHSNQAYGTWSDPEYILRSARWRARLVVFLLLPMVYPLFAFVRFLVLTPIALLSRRGDRLVWTYASSLFVMNETYRREYDFSAHTAARWALELACGAWAWGLAWAVATQRLPLNVVFKVYLVTLFWVVINQVRTLVAHRYRNNPEAPVGYVDQLLDTNTFPRGTWLPELWAPVGLRYHALHHLLPMLPYHAMREAHQRLMRQLPADSPYHRTIRRGLWPTLLDMLRDPDSGRHVAHSAIAAKLREDPRATR